MADRSTAVAETGHKRARQYRIGEAEASRTNVWSLSDIPVLRDICTSCAALSANSGHKEKPRHDGRISLKWIGEIAERESGRLVSQIEVADADLDQW